MSEINEKIKGNIMSADGKIVKETNNISEDDVIIHTIPKRFLAANLPNSKAKGIGLIILISGGAVLVLGGVFLYLYIFNSNLLFPRKGQVELNNEVNTAAENEASSSEVTTENKTSGQNENKTVGTGTKAINEIGSSSTGETAEERLEKKATSTVTKGAEEQATTTFSIDDQAGATSAPVSLIVPVDTDNDGLFDIEESLYGSNINLRDSDGDTYEDLVEILKLYNPTGNGNIIVNDHIKKYVNSRFAYYLYYPLVWQASNVGGEDSVVFDTGNNQFIQVIVQANPEKKTLSEWYLANTNLSVIDNDQILYKKGWEGIKSPDGLTVYLTKPGLNSIVIMTYSLGVGNILNYKNVFNMMTSSLEISN